VQFAHFIDADRQLWATALWDIALGARCSTAYPATARKPAGRLQGPQHQQPAAAWQPRQKQQRQPALWRQHSQVTLVADKQAAAICANAPHGSAAPAKSGAAAATRLLAASGADLAAEVYTCHPGITGDHSLDRLLRCYPPDADAACVAASVGRAPCGTCTLRTPPLVSEHLTRVLLALQHVPTFQEVVLEGVQLTAQHAAAVEAFMSLVQYHMDRRVTDLAFHLVCCGPGEAAADPGVTCAGALQRQTCKRIGSTHSGRSDGDAPQQRSNGPAGKEGTTGQHTWRHRDAADDVVSAVHAAQIEASGACPALDTWLQSGAGPCLYEATSREKLRAYMQHAVTGKFQQAAYNGVQARRVSQKMRGDEPDTVIAALEQMLAAAPWYGRLAGLSVSAAPIVIDARFCSLLAFRGPRAHGLTTLELTDVRLSSASLEKLAVTLLPEQLKLKRLALDGVELAGAAAHRALAAIAALTHLTALSLARNRLSAMMKVPRPEGGWDVVYNGLHHGAFCLSHISGLKELRLASTGLGHDGLHILREEMLPNISVDARGVTALRRLDLGQNRLLGPNGGARALKMLLWRLTSLTSLALESTGLRASSLKALADPLARIRSLQHLSLAGNDFSRGCNAAHVRGHAADTPYHFLASVQHVHDLDLSSCSLTADDVRVMARPAPPARRRRRPARCTLPSSVTRLDLDGNDVDEEMLDAVKWAFPTLRQLHTGELDAAKS
jgi:hypothetical protein